MKRYIKTALMPELLAYLGYTDAKAAGEEIYQVTGYGISYPGILRDEIPDERELGMRFGLALLSLCNEVWIFQDKTGLSSGMAAEEAEAKRLHKVIRYFDLQEVSA